MTYFTLQISFKKKTRGKKSPDLRWKKNRVGHPTPLEVTDRS